PPGDGAEPTPDADLGKILTQLLNADTSKAEKGWDRRLATAVQNLQESFGCPSGVDCQNATTLERLEEAYERAKERRRDGQSRTCSKSYGVRWACACWWHTTSGDLLPPSDVLKELFKAKED
ncbi:hypothetical protein FOZ63_019852, partial [Perkinsus olseni]